MERAEWLKKMRTQAEALYDHLGPAYWVTFGVQPDPVHHEFVAKFLQRLPPNAAILDAGCGAGRFDGVLVEDGHRVLGIDQSAGMLRRAREHFPEARFPTLRYEKMGLQEMDFRDQFDGVACIQAMEHVSPEDWPGILQRLRAALKPGGVLYLALDMPDWDEVRSAHERALAQGLPAVHGEVVDEVDAALAEVAAQDSQEIHAEKADHAVYHYYPSDQQVETWLEQAGLRIEEEGTGDGYRHLLVRSR